MDAIILAAGYGTRLGHLTHDTPKPLLKVAGKPIIEHIIGKLEEAGTVDTVHVVTNAKFHRNFKEWLHNFKAKLPVEIINDGTTSNENRLGAIGDIHHAINEKMLNDDIIVVAGDNLFELSLKDIALLFRKKGHNAIVLHDVKDQELAKHYGVVAVEDNIVTDFEEKPVSPKSTLVSTGIYLFPRKTISLIGKYIEQGNNPDKTGNFIEWLHKREKVYAFVTDKRWYDIGNLEQLQKADKHFKSKL